MLTVAPPFYQLHGTTVFRDHEDATLFYFLPSVTRLKRHADGSPALTLYKYRRDLTDNPELDPTRAAGAGLALFEVEADIDRRSLIEMDLRTATGVDGARLVPVPFRSGEVRAIIAQADGDTLIEELMQERRAPLVAPHSAAFALALRAEGATLFEHAIQGGRLPLGVVYDLRFLALMPALHARVTMDYERIYDHFATSVGFTYYVSLKLDADLAWLVENDLVRIDITAFTDEEDRKRQEALVLGLVKSRIQGDFFRSGVPDKPQEGAVGPLAELLSGLTGGGDLTSASAFFVLKARFEAVQERKEFVLEFDSRSAVELTHVCSGLIDTMLASDEADPSVGAQIVPLDLDDPFYSSLEVRVGSVIDFAQMSDLKEVHAHFTFGEHRQSFSFLPPPPDGVEAPTPSTEPELFFRSPLTDPAEDEYEVSVEYHFDAEVGTGPRRMDAGPFRSRSRVWVVDPLDHLRYRRVRLLLGPLDPALVPRIHAQLRAPGEDGEPDLVQETIVLGTEHPEAVWRMRQTVDAPALRILVRSDWEDPSGTIHRGREESVAGESVVLMGPYEDVLRLSLQAAVDWARVSQVLVELRFVHGEQRFDRQHVFTAESAGSAIEEFPLLDRNARTYEWRQVVFFLDGTVAQTPWTSSDSTILAVGATQAAREVRIVWVGDPGSTLGVRADLHVDTPQGTRTISAFLRTGEMEASITLPVDAAPRYRYLLSRVHATGIETIRSGEDESNLLVVQT